MSDNKRNQSKNNDIMDLVKKVYSMSGTLNTSIKNLSDKVGDMEDDMKEIKNELPKIKENQKKIKNHEKEQKENWKKRIKITTLIVVIISAVVNILFNLAKLI